MRPHPAWAAAILAAALTGLPAAPAQAATSRTLLPLDSAGDVVSAGWRVFVSGGRAEHRIAVTGAGAQPG